MDPNLLSKENKNKSFLGALGGGAKDMMPPSWALGGHGRVAPPPLDPPVAVRKVRKLLYAKWFHDTVYCIPVNDINRKLEMSGGRSGTDPVVPPVSGGTTKPTTA